MEDTGMSDLEWTKEELSEFDRAIDENDSRDQVTRIRGRLAINRMVKEFGLQKCDAMFAHLEAKRKKPKRKSVKP
jgi:hypothetical protein